jgi:hypothetical protein
MKNIFILSAVINCFILCFDAGEHNKNHKFYFTAYNPLVGHDSKIFIDSHDPNAEIKDTIFQYELARRTSTGEAHQYFTQLKNQKINELPATLYPGTPINARVFMEYICKNIETEKLRTFIRDRERAKEQQPLVINLLEAQYNDAYKKMDNSSQQ